MKISLFKSILFSAILLSLVSSCNKEATVPEAYLRSGNSLAIADDNGNLIIAGYNTSSTSGYDAALIKTNSAGDTLWSKKFGSTYSDAFYNVSKSNSGGFIATGFSNKSASNSPAMYVVIADANGKLVSSGKFGGSYYSQGFNVLRHSNPDSGYLVSGYIQNSTYTDRDLYLVRLNNAGVSLWEKRYGTKNDLNSDTVNDAAYAVIAAPDGGYFLTGSIKGYSSCCGKVFLMKVSAKGDSLWTKTYVTGVGYSLILTKDNSIAISGSLQEGTSQDIFLLKTDTAGNLLWPAKSFGGTGYEYGASMIETSTGGFAITGITDSKGTQDVYLIRTDSNGGLLGSTSTYGGTSDDQGFGIVEMANGDYCITGLSNTDGSYFFLNRVSSEGAQIWYNPFK
jgi:hypothetical protein